MAVDDRLQVAVLMGGTSAEHDVSICSGLNVADGLDLERFVPVPVYIDRGGSWHFETRPPEPSLQMAPGQEFTSDAIAPAFRRDVDERGAFERLRAGAGIDVVFIALHGSGGEDGAVQGMLTLAGVPFTGSGVLASAVAMDKALTKRLLRGAGVPIAEDQMISAHALTDRERLESTLEVIGHRIGFPCVVKPVVGGSSFGTRLVRERHDLDPALRAALSDDRRALIERYLDGTEITCGVLGGGVEPSMPLPLTEIVPVGEEFFDFRAKYTVGACDEITPARVDEDTTRKVQELAVVAHETLGCEGLSRSDFILTSDGPVFLETNTVPGLTRTSLFQQAAAVAGIAFPELIERLIESALRRATAAGR